MLGKVDLLRESAIKDDRRMFDISNMQIHPVLRPVIGEEIEVKDVDFMVLGVQQDVHWVCRRLVWQDEGQDGGSIAVDRLLSSKPILSIVGA